jgi:hypothetical protein
VEDELHTQLGDNFLMHGSILSSGHTIRFKYWIKRDNLRSHIYQLNSSTILEEAPLIAWYLVLTSNVSSFPSNSANAANPYLQTQVGIDLGGKQLADEVKKPLHVQ